MLSQKGSVLPVGDILFIKQCIVMKKMHAIVAMFIAVFAIGLAVDVNAAAIGNTVWNDRNANGVHDAGEEGIAGVKVKLYHGNDVEDDKTNSQGRYKFKDLDAGHYTLIVAQETLPEGCYATHDRDGDKDGEYGKKYLHEDDYYTHADFGYHCPSSTSVSVGQVSPVTGPGTAAMIIALAVAVGAGFIVYKRRTTAEVTKK